MIEIWRAGSCKVHLTDRKADIDKNSDKSVYRVRIIIVQIVDILTYRTYLSSIH